MKLQQLIHPERVFLGLSAADARSALSEIADRIAGDLGLPAENIRQALLEREELGSTGVGHGFAIPHCKLHGISEIQLIVAKFPGGIEFHAVDGQPVTLMFVVLSPPDQPAAHLQVLSQIARILKREELRKELLAAETSDALVAAVRHAAEVEGL
ncbi:MAG: PTS sugar transporter subunit IIA [Acidobacteria bacterium]|nr:PTS sugar transporter subunit IIA [Acidobacteriota bacterium]